ncbi:LysE family translocator [Pelagibius sp. Alg239-R121]|uniref:LysE family translocator n=1 Tax=Pelagibius sp. Alg239-R121 TaxID=2993448 RepID=UPI0024A6B179|nr:LysE family translocator [Pelagibius sp. Alg239-R121]
MLASKISLEYPMLNGALLLGFVAAALVVLVLPGPGVFYVMARTLGQGTRAGLISALGLSVGVFAHVAAAVAGLSAILTTSATAFEVVRMLGAGYLIYLGLSALLSARKTKAGAVTAASSLPSGRIFRDGVIVSILNPKIAVFFLAFLPQFVDQALGAVPLQILLLGLIYAALAVMTDGSYALLAGNLRHRLRGRLVQGSLPQYFSGFVYLGLGLHTLLTGRRD